MMAGFRTWWQYIRKHWVAAIITAFVVALIFAGYRFDWTGFNGYNKVSIQTDTTSSPPKITRTEEYQPGKTLWDWLGLLAALAIPVVVGVGAAWFTAKQAEESNAENKDNQRETALQGYIDKMSELLLHGGLRRSQSGAEVRNIALARTVAVMHTLDARRIAIVIRFLSKSELIAICTSSDLHGIDLHQANLIQVDLNGVNLVAANLNGADLRDTDLSRAFLNGANLSQANLSKSDLQRVDLRKADLHNANLNAVNLHLANLIEANLREADLHDANLFEANLGGANLFKAKVTDEQLAKAMSLEGATMPDGSIHP